MRAQFRIPAALTLAALLAGGVAAKAPADYLHGSAHKYIAGRHQEALVEAEEGLRLFPDDPTLKTLTAHLRRLKDQQRQDQGNQGSSGGDQGQDKKDKQQGDQGQGDNQDNPQDKDKEKDQGGDGKEKDDKGGGQGEEPKQEEEGRDSAGAAQAPPVKPGEMSKEDAERLLNSIQDDEKKEHKQQQRRWRKRPEVEQDW